MLGFSQARLAGSLFNDFVAELTHFYGDDVDVSKTTTTMSEMTFALVVSWPFHHDPRD